MAERWHIKPKDMRDLTPGDIDLMLDVIAAEREQAQKADRKSRRGRRKGRS